MENKVFMICGGSGFIGVNLTKRLLAMNNKVICIDNFSSSDESKIKQFLGNKNYSFIYKDIIDLTSFDEHVDYIINLACVASPTRYFKDPIHTLLTSVVGVRNLLEIATKQNAVILQSSTSEVYGNPNCEEQSEEYNGNVSCVGKRACYDEGKRSAETLMCDYHRLYNTDIRIIRIFNTYGEYMDYNDGRVISNFIVQALKGEPITVHDYGKHTRSYQYIDDLIDGMLLVLKSNIHTSINLGNPDERTIQETAQKIIELTNSNSKIIYTEGYPDDPTRRKPNIDKARKLLNWYPKVTFEQGLKNTIEYFKNII